jgi:hypothetical protein
LDEQSGHHNEKASRPLLTATQSGHATAGVVELGDRELARANLVLRFSAVRPRQWNGKPNLDVGLLRLR